MNAFRVIVVLIVVDVFASLSPLLAALFGIQLFATSAVVIDTYKATIPEPLETIRSVAYNVAVIVGWCGIAARWNPARFLYLLAWILSIVGVFSMGTVALTPLGFLWNGLVGFTGGLLVCFIFLGEGRHEFGRHNKTRIPSPITLRVD